MALQWEELDLSIHRTKIHGGWLVHRKMHESNSAVLYVEDPSHEWIGHWDVIDEGKILSFSFVPKIMRSKVPKGWLVAEGVGKGTIAFVPDPNHEWDGNSLP